MAVMTQLAGLRRVPMSREAFESLAEGPPFYDYVDGEAVEVNRPSVRHSDIVVSLTAAIKQHVKSHALGRAAAEVSLELPNSGIFGPDILFIASENSGCRLRERGDFVGAPDLIVEVLSPSTESYDRHEKMPRYHRAGVKWVWLVSQESLLVEEYRWSDDGYTLMLPAEDRLFRPRLFGGLELNLVDLVGDTPSAE